MNELVNWLIGCGIQTCEKQMTMPQGFPLNLGGHNLLTYLPVRSSNMRIPKDQQSAPKSWPLFMMTSGATYSGVPQNVQVFFPRPIFLAKPKSAWVESRGIRKTHATPFKGKPAWRGCRRVAYHFNITLSVQQKVFRFQVSVDDAHSVEVIERL